MNSQLSQKEIIDAFFSRNSARQYSELDRFSGGPWVFVDKANNAFVSHDEPKRLDDNEWDLTVLNDVVKLPYAMSIALTHKTLTWEDAPMNICHSTTPVQD